jgi:hypothetical protein
MTIEDIAVYGTASIDATAYTAGDAITKVA